MKDWKNALIAVLGISVVALAALLLREHRPDREAPPPAAGDPAAVSVIDVILDRESMATLDVLFDKPLGEKKVGEILGRDPARIEPKITGSWRWQGESVLRFEAPQRFAMATEYELRLFPDRFLAPGQRFVGETEHTFVTDAFRVEKVDVYGEPAGEEGKTVLRGELRFNYAVDPRIAATRIRLVDPLRGETDPVPVHFDVHYRTQALGLRSDPVEKRREERTLTLTILSDLTSVEGNVPLPADYVQTIALGSNERLAVRGTSSTPGEAESMLRVRLSSPVDPRAVAPFVKVAPEVRFRISTERDELVLTGAFAPGSTYSLALDAGLPGRDGSKLAERFGEKIAVADLPAAADFESQGMFLSARGERALAVKSVNTSELFLTIDRVYRNNVFYLFENYGWTAWRDQFFNDRVQRSLGDRIASERIEISSAKNESKRTAIRLDRHLEKKEPGLYRVGITRSAGTWGTQRWLLVTDLGIVARQGEDDLLVWVTSFDTLAPVANAEVRLVSSQNQLIAAGRTDATGMWRAAGLAKRLTGTGRAPGDRAIGEGGEEDGAAVDPESDRIRPYMITASAGEDWSFLLLERSEIDVAGLDVGGARASRGGYAAFLYGERDLYRPGETVEGLAVVRDRGLAPPPPMPALLRHRDPEGKARETKTLETDAGGLAPFTIDVPSYERTGNHTLELVVAEEVIGQYRFQVEEFVPDRIRVEVRTERSAFTTGEKVAFDAAANYLFGPPAAGLSVESRVRLVNAEFRPPGFDAFTFRNPGRKFDDREIFSSRESLDAEGRHAFETALPPDLEPPSSLEAVVTARVQESGGRGVAAMRRVRVHPWPRYVGLRHAADGAIEPQTRTEIEWVLVTPEGAEAKGGKLRAEFFHDRWQTVLRRTAAGNFRYESVRDAELLETREVDAADATRGRLPFTPSRFGAYRVVVTELASGASAELEFYASGWGYSPWAIKDPGRIELSLDRAEYAPGDTAKLEVRAPFSGKLFLTVERENVFTTSIHDLPGNTASIPIRIDVAFRPNAYVTATLVRKAAALEPGSAGRAFGAIPLNVDREANRIAVKIEAAAEIRPGTKLAIDVSVGPEAADAALTVAAVDEGILQLIQQKTPDPFAFFYQKLALAVRGFDIFALLLPEVRGVEGTAPPGGGEALAGMQQFLATDSMRRPEAVAFWSGVVRADGQGRARVEIDVPEFQGALRLMAVALHGARFGSAEGATRVRDPLVVLPTFPRVLSFAERAELAVAVRNDTGKDGRFEVKLAVEGPIAIDGEAIRAVDVKSGAEATVTFPITTGESDGTALFRLSASGNGETTSATGSAPLRPDLPPQTVEKTGTLAERKVEFPVAEAASFRKDTLRRELRIARTPLLQLSAQLRTLLRYPYGCTEQVVSSAFPLLQLGDLVKELDPGYFDERGDPAVIVEEAIRRVASTQLDGGGFALWPGSHELHPWTSVYTTHFLVEARRAGFTVDDFLHDRAVEWLAAEARTKEQYGRDELERAVYALYVLARIERADPGTMDVIRGKHSKGLRADSRALLAAAYAESGNRDALDELLAGIEDAETIERQTGYNFASTVRSRALLLLAFLGAAPDDARVPKIAQRLARDADANPWWTTQESSFALLALGELFRRQSEKSPYAGRVLLEGAEIGTFSSDRPAVFRDLGGVAPLRVELEEPYSKGAAFFALHTRGVPTDDAFRPEAKGLEITRSFLTRDGSPLDVANVAQGDLVVMRVSLRSVSGRVDNVVVVNLLPSGLEVENPRLKSAETLPWIGDADLDVAHLDLRDDRVLVFANLPDSNWRTYYALLRAVTRGTFRLPPVQAEAMYDPALRVTGERGTLHVTPRP